MARIESVDIFYLAMPEILDIGDGSQDLTLVRVQAGEHVGWGECEASPLPTIAALVTPMSHSACKPVRDSVLGQPLDNIEDIHRITRLVRENSLDLLQSDHTLSGIDIALWDTLGKSLSAPVWQLLGVSAPEPRLPYASQLFGDTPDETFAKCRASHSAGYRAVKVGWGPYGRGSVEADADQVAAARAGLGPDGILLVDAGTVWGDDVSAAVARLPSLQAADVTWLEEPFVAGALDSYRDLGRQSGSVRLAGGEGCHDPYAARTMIDHAGLGFIQVDAGRIGGITSARRVAEYAATRGVPYVNHTFTSHLALSASLQPFADSEVGSVCEYPVEPKSLATAITRDHILPGTDGMIRLSERPGLGIDVNVVAARAYLVDTEITAGGRVLYRTPDLVD
jgi:L-alanine-DL-glutamate epimerase-like enolase superfamily enzyme